MTCLLQHVFRTSSRCRRFTNYLQPLIFHCDITSRGHVSRKPVQMKWLRTVEDELDIRMEDISWSDKEIQKLQEFYVEQSKNKSLQSFDVIVMSKLKANQKAKFAKEFMDYIKQRRTPHLLVMISYLRCYFNHSPGEVLKEYNVFKKTIDFSTVNVNTLIDLIDLEARTKAWRRGVYEILKLLDKEVEVGESRQVISSAAANVLAAAIQCSNYDMMMDMAYKHPHYFIVGLAKNILMPVLFEQLMKRNMPLDLFLHILNDIGKDTEMNLKKYQAVHIVGNQHRHKGWTCKLSEIDRRSGQCMNCNNTLKREDITDSDLQLLEKVIYENVVVGENIYNKTTPEDYEKYLMYLENSSNYDVVVDGPNLYFGCDQDFWIEFKRVVRQLKQYLGKTDIKILVLSDKWRFKDFYKIPIFFKDTVDLYAVDFSKSHDDVFLLLAALKNKRRTFFISNDNYRNHRALLTLEQTKIFRRWQSCYQILHYRKYGQIELDFPSAYRGMDERSDQVWHVPYETEDSHDPRRAKAYFKNSHLYVCITKQDTYRKSRELKNYLEIKNRYQNDS